MKMEVVRVEVSATIPASPDAVWDVVSVFDSQAKDNAQMVMHRICLCLVHVIISGTVRIRHAALWFRAMPAEAPFVSTYRHH